MGALHLDKFDRGNWRDQTFPNIRAWQQDHSTTAEEATDTADAIAMRRVFQLATAWCNSLPPQLTNVAGKAAPVIIAAMIIQAVAIDERRKGNIIASLDVWHQRLMKDVIERIEGKA